MPDIDPFVLFWALLFGLDLLEQRSFKPWV